ncbi:carbohydrate ABC transporter permease [Alicyclobacillus sp. SO9]|uniref:carbohydrate ABC transporter permease n=1 Tax=Alicyclobacillus sp. SO9 TaxID=2665646 RepID=UPI0018E73A5A|nr:sugar ABC transporter permease [Alicyclobacillus sp. SO9]QQE80243.1 sugar ABC transporter permease [Alicyclobacillus sp. SO9]
MQQMTGNTRLRYKIMKGSTPYVLIFPNLLLFFVFIILPAIFGLIDSFARWNGIEPLHFIGLGNYVALLTSHSFWTMLWRTFRFILIAVPLTFFVSLWLAYLLSKDIRGRSFFRMVFYAPAVISAIVTGVAWKWILSSQFGVLNYALHTVGIRPVDWLVSGFFASLSVVVVSVWSWAGFYMLIFIAGLQSIPIQYYEAAALDGASPFRRFWSVTFPLLRPTSLLVVILNTIQAFQTFALVYVLTDGGPGNTTRFFVQDIYETGFNTGRFGYASALSVMLFVILAVLTVIQLRLGRQGENDL